MRKRAVADQDVAGTIRVIIGAKPEVVVLVLRGWVDPAPLIARERALLVVAGDDVVAELGTDGLEPVPEVTDDREVAQDRMTLLRHVVEREDQEQRAKADTEPCRERHDSQSIPRRAVRVRSGRSRSPNVSIAGPESDGPGVHVDELAVRIESDAAE